MKLAARDIPAFLAKPDKARGALIYGPDHGLIHQRTDAIIALLLKDPQDPFCRTDMSGKQLLDDPVRLADELAAFGLMGGRRVVVIRDIEDKSADAVLSAINEGEENNYLLVTAGEMNPRSGVRKLFESDKRLAALPCYKDEGVGLTQIIEKTLTERGFKTNREIITYLTQQLNGDRMLILSELEKLMLYHKDQPLTLESVRLSVGDSQERSLDDICNAVMDGQMEMLFRSLDRLMLEGVPEIMLLRSLHRYFSRLQEIHQLAGQGISVDDAVAKLRPPVFFKEQPRLKRQAQRWRPAKIEKALHILLETERDVKLANETSAILCSHALLRLAAAA